jgi:histidine phosphotransferase ChpT
MTQSAIDPLELAALIASRVCHDLISPIGAIANGLEVLEEEKDEAMRAFAMDLIRNSAGQASSKLQFARIAFGASGGAGAEIDMREAGRCAAAMMAREKAGLDWQVSAEMLPKLNAKLLMNLLIVATACVARGGMVRVAAAANGAAVPLRIAAEGERARLSNVARQVLVEGGPPDPLDAHAVQPLYCVLLAHEAGMALRVSEEADRVVFEAVPQAA